MESLILLLIDSTLALLNPCSMVLRIFVLWRLILCPSSLKIWILLWVAFQKNESMIFSAASRLCCLKTNLNNSFNLYALNSLTWVLDMKSNLAFWFSVRFSGAFPKAYSLSLTIVATNELHDLTTKNQELNLIPGLIESLVGKRELRTSYLRGKTDHAPLQLHDQMGRPCSWSVRPIRWP